MNYRKINTNLILLKNRANLVVTYCRLIIQESKLEGRTNGENILIPIGIFEKDKLFCTFDSISR